MTVVTLHWSSDEIQRDKTKSFPYVVSGTQRTLRVSCLFSATVTISITSHHHHQHPHHPHGVSITFLTLLDNRPVCVCERERKSAFVFILFYSLQTLLVDK